MIAGALQKRRGGAPLDLYEVRPEVDGDGAEFLWITVVHDGAPHIPGIRTTGPCAAASG